MSKWHLDDHAALFKLFVRLPPPSPHGLSWLRICLQYGRAGFDPWVRKTPREGKGYPLQYSVLENSMDCIVHRVAKSQIQLRDFHFPLPHQMQSNSPINKPIKDCSIKIQKCPGANRQVQWQFTALPCNVLNISVWCKSGFPGSQTQRFRLQCRRWFGEEGDPWVRKIPWRRAWQATPVFLPGESPWTEEPGGLQSMGLQRVGHDWVTNAKTWCKNLSWLEQTLQWPDRV